MVLRSQKNAGASESLQANSPDLFVHRVVEAETDSLRFTAVSGHEVGVWLSA